MDKEINTLATLGIAVVAIFISRDPGLGGYKSHQSLRVRTRAASA